MTTLPGLVKDPSPPATDTVISPITIPNGTILLTTKSYNQLIDYVSGDAGPNFIPQIAIDNLISDLAGKEDSLGFTPEDSANKDNVNGYAGLDGSSLISNSQIPSGIPADKISSGDVNNTEFDFLDGVTSSIQTQLNGKEDSLGFTPEDSANKNIANGYAGLDGSSLLNVNQIPTGISADKISSGDVNNTEFDFLDGVTSSIQTQLNGKEDSSNKGISNGYAPLNTFSLVPIANLGTGVPDGTKFLRDDGTFIVPAGASGEVNTASNIGVGGIGIFAQKVGDDLQFKNLISNITNKITITDNVPNDEIVFDINESNLTTVEKTANKNISGGYAGLDGSSLISSSQIPSGISADKISSGDVNNTEFDFLDGVTSSIQIQLNGKEDSLGFTPEDSANKNIVNGYAGLDGSSLLNVNQIPTGISADKISSGDVNNTEFDFLDGVTSSIQTQLNGKEDSSNKGAISGYAGLDVAAILLLTNFPTGTALQVLRRNVTNDALEFAPSAAGEFFGPYTNTHDVGNQILDNVGLLILNEDIQMINNKSIIWESNRTIRNTTDGFFFQIETGDFFKYQINAIDEYVFDELQADFKGNNIVNVPEIDFEFGLKIKNTISTLATIDFDNPSAQDFTLAVKGNDYIVLHEATQSIILNNTLDLNSNNIVNVAIIDFEFGLKIQNTEGTDAIINFDHPNATNLIFAVKTADYIRLNDASQTIQFFNQLDLNNFRITNVLEIINVGDITNVGKITNVGEITMSDSTEIRWTNGNRRIFNDASGFIFEVEIGANFSLRIDTNNEYTFNATQADFGNNALMFADSTDIKWVNGNRRIHNSGTGFIFEVESGDIFQYVIDSSTILEISNSTINSPSAKFQENGKNISPIGLHDIWFDAGGLNPVDSGGLTSRIIGTGDNQKSLFYVPFTNGIDSFAVIKFKLPETYDNGDITVVINWTTETEGTGDVVWGIAGVAVSDNTDMTIAGANYGGEITITDTQQTINFSQDTPRSTSITLANTPADGDTIYLRIRRLGTNGSDTFTQDAQLLGVSIQITTDAAVSV